MDDGFKKNNKFLCCFFHFLNVFRMSMYMGISAKSLITFCTWLANRSNHNKTYSSVDANLYNILTDLIYNFKQRI